MNEPSRPSPTSPHRFAPLLSVALVIAALYFAREVCLPLALAVLISFLLAPVVRRFEHWRLSRIPAVLAASALAFTILGAVGTIIAGQLIDLANQLPNYKTNLREKAAAFKTSPNSPLSRATQTVRELTNEITKDAGTSTAPAPAAAGEAPPVPVAVVYTPDNALEILRGFVAPVLAPLGTAAVVIVLVIFMLLEREDLRDRMIHLGGRTRLRLTTQALDDASQRVSRYLLAQLLVNGGYGILIAAGLGLIGIPNAILWGCLGTLLRFVPYLGPLMASAFPIALSLAVSPNWTAPMLTLALFAVVELITNNVFEPWLYGSSTGLSPLAIIVSAVFWTWLWGGAGLLLATPLTVCIAVLGRHLPSLSFLDVLLGDRPPIAPEDRVYQRLLAGDSEEVLEIAEEFVRRDGLAATCDHLIIPVLRLAEGDLINGVLSEDSRREIYRILREIITELGEVPAVNAATPAPEAQILCLPASREADELTALMLARLLAEAGLPARVVSSRLMSGEMVDQAVAMQPRVICVSALPPGSIVPATHLCKRLREHLEVPILTVGMWGETDTTPDERRLQRFKRAHIDHVFTTLAQAAGEIRIQPALALPVAPAAEEKAA